MEEDFRVKNEEIEKSLKEIGLKLKGIMPNGWGYTLFMFDYQKGNDGALFYLSTAKREDMIKTLEEFIKKEKKRK